MPEAKPLKVREVRRPNKLGIVATTFTEALKKGCEKLQIPYDGTRMHLETDGTLVPDDDYFQTLPINTNLVLVATGLAWHGGFDMVKSYIAGVLAALSQGNQSKEIEEFFAEDLSPTHLLLAEFVYSLQGNITAEQRNEDPDWFTDMDQRFKTKSHVMFVKAQERVRGYFSKTREMLVNEAMDNDFASRRDGVIKALHNRLQKNQFHGVYFKRTADHEERLCNEQGWFRCQGAYDTSECRSHHLINPYKNKESMIFFSTWNLDHVIEKSRSVIPGLKEAIFNCPAKREVNLTYFYDLLFTKKNLKLVDVRCHKKRIHSGKVDKKHFYRKPTGHHS